MVSTNELKQIQLNRQHLTDKTDKFTVCHDLNGLQAQIMVNVFYALKIRCNEEITKDNFGDGLLKNWTVRGTVHAFAADDLGVCIPETKRHPYRSENWMGCKHKITGEWIITPKRQGYFSHIILESLKDSVRTRDELKKICEKHGITAREASEMFCPWGGSLYFLCKSGYINHVVQEKKAFALSPSFVQVNENEAVLEWIRRYFTHYAPATIKDAAYYFRCTQTYIKEKTKELPLMQIEIDCKSYFYLEEIKNNYPDIPRCILLAGFDQLMLGYQKQESIYLPQKNIRGIFNLAGIIMPPILFDGVVVGRWRKKNKKMIFELFGDTSTKHKNIIESTMENTFDDIQKTEWIIL